MNKIETTDKVVVTTHALTPTQSIPTPPSAGMVPIRRAVSGNQHGTQAEQLVFYENIVTQSLAREDIMADAIAQIKLLKLYELTGLSFRDYVKGRWDLSKSRAFQLIKFAKLKAQAQANGKTPPTNEREARNLDADGNPLPARNNYGYWLHRAKNQLKGSLAKLTPDEKRKYIADIYSFLDELGKTLATQPSKLNSKPVIPPSKPTGGTQATINAPIPQMPAGQTISQSTVPIPPTPIPTAGGTPQIQPPLAPICSLHQEQGEKAAPANLIKAPNVPNPASYGSHIGMTIEEARARGFVKRR